MIPGTSKRNPAPVGEVEPIETYVLKKKGTQFKTGFLNVCATILNHTFNKIFDIRKMSKTMTIGSVYNNLTKQNTPAEILPGFLLSK